MSSGLIDQSKQLQQQSVACSLLAARSYGQIEALIALLFTSRGPGWLSTPQIRQQARHDCFLMLL